MLEIKYCVDENQYSTTYRFIYYGIGGTALKAAQIMKKWEDLDGAVIGYTNVKTMNKTMFVVSYISFPRDKFKTNADIADWCRRTLDRLAADMSMGLWNSRLKAKLISVIKLVSAETKHD